MEFGLKKVFPDKEKAKSILKMVETTSEMIKTLDAKKFPSNVLKEHYDVIRELIAVIALMDGYKTQGEGAHKKLIDFLAENYPEFTEYEISLIDDLRNMRNRISYDGFFIESEYLERKAGAIQRLIEKLTSLANKKIQ
ncbi:MAG: hypothetical protein KAT83_03565 [Candidatus Aenigmarchaeota archaeon]|nr:hypothetical protein [Candidatus Aenigmarchaeota archaeon]